MTVVPPGGLVLVTGANGLIGGVVVQKFLDAGYRVRGTVRDPAKHSWMLSHYGSNFSLAAVPDMGVEGAFDEVVKGVDGIAHVASPTAEGFRPDPQIAIPLGINFTLGLLKSAAKEPNIKSVVYTSTQAATVMLEPGKPYHVTTESWNEASKVAWTMPITQDFRRSSLNYMCSKTESEQQAFKWVKEHKAHFTFNTVLPNTTFGLTTRPDKTGFASSTALLKMLWNGNTVPSLLFPSQYFIDVEDVALVQVAALTQPDVENERLMAMANRYSWNEILGIMRKIAPDRTFPADIDEPLDMGTVDNGRAEELLKRVKNGKGFSSLEETVKKWSKQMFWAEKEGKDWPLSAVELTLLAFDALPDDQKSLYR